MAGGIAGYRDGRMGKSFVFVRPDLGMIARTFSILTDKTLYDGYQIYA